MTQLQESDDNQHEVYMRQSCARNKIWDFLYYHRGKESAL